MRSLLLYAIVLCTAAQAQSPYPNIQIHTPDPGAYQPCEPSIAVSPKDPSQVVAGAVLNYVYTSKDSGQTWKVDHMTSRYGVYGDPCIIADDKGRFYYFHLSDPSGLGWADPSILDRIVCQKRSRLFKRWSRGSGIGHNGLKDQDKEWAAYDPTTGNLVVCWTEFDEYGSNRSDCHSRILLAMSNNHGKSWSRAVALGTLEGNCIDDSKTAEGAVPAFGPKGEIYITWSINGQLHFSAINQKSFHIPEGDEPLLNGLPSKAITDQAHWSFDIPGLGRSNGMPVTRCDRSDGAHQGTIYVNWADQRNGTDDTDIWLIKSTDKGHTWSDPVRVNDDPPGKHQFFTWMDVDQSTGYIYIVFYDRRNHDDNNTDVYLAVSKDGGATFKNIRISESPFLPSDQVFFGDYNNISAVNGVVRPIWTRNDQGKLSIWTALINE